MPPWIPFFECLFSEIANEFFTKIIEKGADKKKNKHTLSHTHEIRLIWSSTRTVFWTAKCQILVAKPLKRCPENEQRISLKNQTKGHLRLASVVALSSNGACGAIMRRPGALLL